MKQIGPGTEMVSMRELHRQLGIKKDFSDWVKMWGNEGIEFSPLQGEKAKIGRPAIEYAVSKHNAELIMLRSKAGKENDLSGQLLEQHNALVKRVEQLPQTEDELIAMSWSILQRRVEEQKKLLEQQQHKVEFYDTVANSETWLDIGQVAKLINKCGRNKLYEILREKNILMANNNPYQKYVDAGYFKLIEVSVSVSDEVKLFTKPVVSQKGVEYITKLFD